MRRSVLLLLPLVAACATKPAPVAVVAAPPPPPPVVAPSLPPGASPGMRVPVALPDGSFPTPNQHLSTAATLWHLRAGLNVAALACPGAQGTGIIAGYNGWIARHKAVLAQAETAYAAEFKGGGGDWRDRYDDAMTRLYNYYSQTPARAGLCAAAERILADTGAVPPEGLAGFAPAALGGLDQPFVDFYRAYDAWRTGAMRPVAAPAPLVIASAPTTRAPVVLVSRAVPAAVTAPPPRLTLDPSVFGTTDLSGR
jgi:hypothetical protein